MKKLITIVAVCLAVMLVPGYAAACGEDEEGEYSQTYNGKPFDWYDTKYYEVVSIKKDVIVGENGSDLKHYKLQAKYLEKGTVLKKGDWIMTLSNPKTKKIVTIIELEL